MPVDLNDFEREQNGNATRFVRDVETPVPADETGKRFSSDADTEENRMYAYKKGEHVVKVSKVSNLGWSVTQYEQEGADLVQNVDSRLNAQEAHRVAQRRLDEVAA